MSDRVIELFLFDALVAILKIEFTVQQFDSAESLLHNFNAWDSVIREFEITGEATKPLIENKILSDKNRVVVDFRNLLVHHYFGIDADEVWNVIEDDLPSFKKDIIQSINKIDTILKQELLDSYSESNKYLEFILTFLNTLR